MGEKNYENLKIKKREIWCFLCVLAVYGCTAGSHAAPPYLPAAPKPTKPNHSFVFFPAYRSFPLMRSIEAVWDKPLGLTWS